MEGGGESKRGRKEEVVVLGTGEEPLETPRAPSQTPDLKTGQAVQGRTSAHGHPAIPAPCMAFPAGSQVETW